MEGRGARPQGGGLHALLRAARNHSRRGRLAAGRARRRRPARGHSRRRLLPELHLPHSAFDGRTRRDRAAGFRRRHAVPQHLRRHPQPLGHVEGHVPEGEEPLLRRAPELPRRRRRRVLRQRAERAQGDARGNDRPRGERRRAPRLDRALQRKPPADARGLRLPRQAALEGAFRGRLPADARGPDPGGRGAQSPA